MSSLGSRRGWLLACAISGLALGVGATGCGGSSPSLGGHGDGGGDAASEGAVVENEGGDATTASGQDAGAGDDSPTSNGDDSGETGVPGTDGGDSATAMDTSTDSPVIVAESGADASDAAPASCGATNSACSNGGANGLCEATVCSACTDTTDDANCSSAYGDGGGSGYLCLAGACSPGNCRTDGDCTGASGSLCGVTTPNVCGKCTTDAQCAGNAGGAICNTGTGACVAGTCPGTASNPPVACPVNTADICCAATCQPGAPAGGKSCCPGTAGDTYCAQQLGGAANCANGVCSLCAAATAPINQYTVDPVHGSDTTGNGNTGNGNPATCAFATITRALQVIGNNSAFKVTVTVVGPATVPDVTAETFPIAIPQYVTVTTSTGAVTVNVPAGAQGFRLNSPNAVIDGAGALTISGQTNKATYGIVASTGSATTTQIANLTVSSFLDDGILVENAGVLTIGAGVTSTLNGIVAARRAGLHVTGTGNAVITVASGGAPTHFGRQYEPRHSRG
jgi:hypothetical protein